MYRIVTQPRLDWWPQVDILYTRATDLRIMFTETLTKVTQISHQSKGNQVSLLTKRKIIGINFGFYSVCLLSHFH